MMAPPAQPYQQQQPQPVNAHHHPHQAGGQPPVAQRQQGPGMAQQPVHQGSSHHGGMRRSEKRNSAGQLIIEPDDALSDKEIYPFYGPAGMPPMDMGKESDGGGIGVVDNYSEEEFSKYDMGSRSGAPRPAARHQVAGRYHGPRGEPPVQHSGMAYQERPRPTSPTPPSRAMRPLVEDEPPAGRGPYGRQSSGGGRGQRQPRVRWFVALFDYDPQTMSPNPDTADEELPFQEGELIKIYGGKDQDGFYKGEANGRVGYVPCNMVSEVHMDSETGEPLRARPPQHRGGGNESWGGVMRPQPKRMVALYDYDPAELSPNPDPFSELAFSTGDVIYVYGDMDEDGFYFGECRGQQGLVPSNFLTEAPADYAEAAAGQQRAGGSRHGSMQHKELRGEPSMGGGGPRGPSQGGSQRSHSSAHQAPGGRHAAPPDEHWAQQQHQQHQQQHGYQQPHQQRTAPPGSAAPPTPHYDSHRSSHDQRAAYAARPVVGTAQRW